MRLVKMFTSSCSPFCCGDTLARWRITCSTWSIDRLPLSLGWRASGGIQRSLMYARKSCICVSDVRRATLSSTPVTPTLCIYTVLCIPKVAQPDQARGRPHRDQAARVAPGSSQRKCSTAKSKRRRLSWAIIGNHPPNPQAQPTSQARHYLHTTLKVERITNASNACSACTPPQNGPFSSSVLKTSADLYEGAY